MSSHSQEPDTVEKEFSDYSPLPGIVGPSRPNLDAANITLMKATEDYFSLHNKH